RAFSGSEVFRRGAFFRILGPARFSRSCTIRSMANRVICVVSFLILTAGCSKTPQEKLAQITDEFVYGSLAFSPSAATGAGLYTYQGTKLDELLDDMSQSSIEKQRQFYQKYRNQIAALPADALSAE